MSEPGHLSTSIAFDNLVAAACSKVVETPLTWRMHGIDINLPSDIHGGTHGHRYDMTCAVCRVSDRPEALAVVVRAALESAGVPALLDVAEAAQRVYFVFGEGNGPLESLIHRNDLGEMGAALQKLPQ